MRLAVVQLEGRLALAVYVADSATPAYFILLAWDADRIEHIRDYRYVPYVDYEAEYLAV